MGQISEYTIVGMSASPLAGETDGGFVNLNFSTSLTSLSKTQVSPMMGSITPIAIRNRSR